MRPSGLTEGEITALMDNCPNWQLSQDGTSISLSIKFASFDQAFAFMTEMALIAQADDHHPEWTNSYRRLTITLTTHDVGTLTSLDGAMASKMDEALHRYDVDYIGFV